MPSCVFDGSALVKFYIAETGTEMKVIDERNAQASEPNG